MLVFPDLYHSFGLENETHFTFIKFTEGYFESKKYLTPDEFKIGSLKFLIDMVKRNKNYHK